MSARAPRTFTISPVTATEANTMTANAQIRHISVSPNGILLSDLMELCRSEAGLKGLFRSQMFGATSSLLSAAAGLNKFSKFLKDLDASGMFAKAEAIKTTPRYMDAEERLTKSAERLAILDALQDCRGYGLIPEIMPTMQKESSKEAQAEKAAFAGVSLSLVQEIERKQAAAKFLQEEAAMMLAQGAFFSAETEEEYIDEDGETYTQQKELFIRPESGLKALCQTRDFILGWSKPDFTELGFLRLDIAMLEEACSQYEQVTEYAGEESRTNDEGAASAADLAQGASGKTR